MYLEILSRRNSFEYFKHSRSFAKERLISWKKPFQKSVISTMYLWNLVINLDFVFTEENLQLSSLSYIVSFRILLSIIKDSQRNQRWLEIARSLDVWNILMNSHPLVSRNYGLMHWLMFQVQCLHLPLPIFSNVQRLRKYLWRTNSYPSRKRPLSTLLKRSNKKAKVPTPLRELIG